MRPLIHSLALAVLTFTVVAPAATDTALPWEKDYATAAAKAKAENRPIFLMLTATWCGPCKMLESRTLPSSNVLSGLKEFVWVKAYEDKELNERFGLSGYPTLVFLDSAGERVLEKSSGYEAVGPFLRHILAARQAAKLPLSKELQELQAKTFEPDSQRIQALLRSGDADALVRYLAPLREDNLRENNLVVAKLRLAPGIRLQDVQAQTHSDLPISDSGLLLFAVPRDGSAVPLRVLAPGCKAIDEQVSGDDKAGVLVREFALEKLTAKDAASFSGKVLKPDGTPAANAIVRLCDWDVTRADEQGNFKFTRVTPGTFLVRGEAPGGEFQKAMTFVQGVELKADLPLKAVTTVGIRWALQTKEGCQEFTGDTVRTGEAYFSAAHGRFLLSRGAEVPQYFGSDFMLAADWKPYREHIPKEKLALLESAKPGEPIFWLFDAGPHPNGLHLEQKSFEEIRVVNDGEPYDAKSYFKFLRGDLVSKGQVYTVRCVRRDYYAKMEITDVTVVPEPSTEATAK
jgi:thiol-disulfide isomerase/thioredoxin